MVDILNFAIATTLTAAVILLLKLAAGSKITPRGHMLLWLVLAVQIACVPLADILPESELAARSYLPQLTETPSNMTELPDTEDYSVRGTFTENIDGTFGGEGYRQTISMKLPFADENISRDYYVSTAKRADEKLLFMICWGIGSAIVLAVFIIGGIKRKRRVIQLSDCSDTETLMILDEMKKRAGIKENRHINIKCGSSTTFLMKIHCPQHKQTAKTADGKLFSDYYVICMEDGFSQEEKRHVIAHELTHLKHGDLWLNLLSAAFIAVFWWNPVIWLAFRRFRRDMEVYCDYDAVKLTESKKEYAKTLVKAASANSGFILGTTSFIGGEKEVSMRVKAIAAFKKPKILVILLAVILLCTGCVCLILNPKSEISVCEEYFSNISCSETNVDIKSVYLEYYDKEMFVQSKVGDSDEDDLRQRKELAVILSELKKSDFARADLTTEERLKARRETGEGVTAIEIEFYNGDFMGLYSFESEEDVYYILCGSSEGDAEESINEEISSCKITAAALSDFVNKFDYKNKDGRYVIHSTMFDSRR